MNCIQDKLDLQHASGRALVMGIVNVTPDSFSTANTPEQAVDEALKMLDDGADILDIGGESTRPGAAEITPEVEISRVIPVLRKIKKLRPDSCISIDTRKSSCAHIALDNGADIINDVSGLTYSPDMAEIIAGYDAYCIIMHSLAKGRADAEASYNNMIREITDFLNQQLNYAVSCGVTRNKIIIDPGIGFSKNTEENFTILQNIPQFSKIAPVLTGHSRKKFLRDFTGLKTPQEADHITALIAVLAEEMQTAIVRVHNVRETVDFLNIARKIRRF